MRLYSSVTLHDSDERQSFLRTLKHEYQTNPVCHNDTIEFYYVGDSASTRALAGICMKIQIHSVHLSA